MSDHRVRRLVTAALAVLASTGLAAPPAVADDGCGPQDSFNGWTMQACLHVRPDLDNTWAYYARLTYDGQDRNWDSCMVQLRLFNGAEANIQVRYHEISCDLWKSDPSGHRAGSSFNPQPGHRYKAKARLVGVLNGQAVANEVVSDIWDGSDASPTAQTIGGLASTDSLPLPWVIFPIV